MRSNFIENIVYETIGLKQNENDWLWNSKLKSITLVPYDFQWILMAFFDSFLEIWWIIMDKEWYLDKNILIRKKWNARKIWWAIISIYDILDYNKEFLFVFSFH